MLLLADRAYDAADLMKEVSAAGAHFLIRGSATRKPPVDEVLPDGSYLSRVDGLRVRIIEAGLDVHGADGTRLGDSYRLITTLLDWRRYPAGELAVLYHERWEIEIGHRWYRSSCAAFSWWRSFVVAGFRFLRCPAGAAVEARRACPAFA
jgi:hypothetical protein